MKKSLIAAAVAGLFVAPAAMAEVTISGAIATGLVIGSSSDGTGGANSGFSREALAANYSNINIGSVDDIGNGLKVMFNYQLVVDVTATAGNPVNRNSYLGIGGDWGNLKYGTNENVYERMMYSSDFMDGALGPGGNLMILGTPGIGRAFDVGQGACGAPGTAGCAGFYRRSDQTIWYESPNFGGFSFEVDYTTSAFKNVNGTTNPQILSIGGRFQPEGAGWFVDAAYESHSDMFGLAEIAGAAGDTGADDTGMQIGGGMTFGNFQVNLRYEMLEYESDGRTDGLTSYERNAYWLGGKMNLPSGYAALQIGMAEEGESNLGDNNDSDATHIAIGYFHNLSKQSQLQFIYNQTDNGDNANYLAVGGTNAVAGADHKGLYVGIKHTF